MPLPGTTEQASQTSAVFYAQGAHTALFDANWRAIRKLDTTPPGSILRIGSPNLALMLVHTDNTSSDCCSVEAGYILMTDDEYTTAVTGPLQGSQIRRIFGVQRWIQNGSQPPIQSARMGKLVTLHENTSLVLCAKFTTLNGSGLSGGRLAYAWRGSIRETTV